MKCSSVRCGEGLSNRVSIIIRRYTDNIKVVAYVVDTFISILSCSSGYNLYHSIYGCVFCTILFNFVNYVIFIVIFMYSYYYVFSVLCILFHCVVLCTVCV